MKLIDITNKCFGAWKVMYRSDNGQWFCKCRCGTKKDVDSQHLRTGASTNCGCLRIPGNFKHGGAIGLSSKNFSITYKTWRSMRARCINPKNSYAKGGITICKRWNNYSKFLEDMGPRPSLEYEIDRLDSKGNYEPDNCRWATAKQQVENLPQNQKGYKHKTRYGVPR